jgi:obg-like ATPase 1
MPHAAIGTGSHSATAQRHQPSPAPPQAMPPKKGEEEVKAVGAGRFGRCKGNLKMGLVGLPNVGKSSTFNLFCGQSVPAENFPFCTIEPSEARCEVPDERYSWLVDLWKAPSNIPPYLQVTDIAGLIRGASAGDGLGNEFLSTIIGCDGIFHVVRAFDDDAVIHVDDSVDPVRDLETIQSELCAKDLDFVLKAEAREQVEVKKDRGSKLSACFLETFKKMKEMLEAGLPIRDGEFTSEEVHMINQKTSLITTKPIIYIINLSKKDFLRKKNKHLPKIKAWIDAHGGGLSVPYSVEFEQELADAKLGGDEALAAFLTESYGETLPKIPSALQRIIKQGFKQLGLIYFFTVGADEVKAWTVFGGATAPNAAGVIHTDFERGFIKAEVVSRPPRTTRPLPYPLPWWPPRCPMLHAARGTCLRTEWRVDGVDSVGHQRVGLVQVSYKDYRAVTTRASEAEVKAAGKLRQEGKTYVMVDGDIVHFQFNVTAKKK